MGSQKEKVERVTPESEIASDEKAKTFKDVQDKTVSESSLS